ncbi:hypothetical protein PENSUB_6005 [Penicillium subrubescens]|uniref:Uncharacterized protein n=1 Tax=Penicillium subrubescens TaxID=1316194 RepID=A0A1Q5U4M2_9EURO|nr:hypothetical protein PENSUB_6005 [Penicillium subrubescens]
MAPPLRPSDFDARFLRRLVGTKVTTIYAIDPPQEPSAVSPSASGISASVASLPAVAPPEVSPPPASFTPASHTTASHATARPTTASSATAPSLSFPGSPPPGICRSWIIAEKLSERAVYLTKEEFEMGVGTPMTVGKFLCHLEEGPAHIAFMRIYYQIPITGTEDADLATLVQQIRPPEVCGEREAFRLLMSQKCSAVPRFLGYDESTQGEHDLVPGGYIKYLVWEKVPGESLTEEFFWSLDLPTRDDIRAKFRVAFESVFANPGWEME